MIGILKFGRPSIQTSLHTDVENMEHIHTRMVDDNVASSQGSKDVKSHGPPPSPPPQADEAAGVVEGV